MPYYKAFLAGVAVFAITPVFASQRTFVASFGNDAANLAAGCTISLPCRSFQSAATKTDPGGEIVVLDSAGYGSVTIAKSLSIIAPAGVSAGISVFSGDGIVINGTGVDVVLRGLSVNGLGGDNGINFLSGNSLRIENCIIARMASNGVQAKAANSTVFVTGTQVRNSGQSGIYLEGPQRDFIENVRAESNLYGVYARSGPVVDIMRTTIADNSHLSFPFGTGIGIESSTASTSVVVSASLLLRNTEGIKTSAVTGFATNLVVSGSVIEGDSATLSTGIDVTSPGTTAMVAGNVITHNFAGYSLDPGSVLFTRGDNIGNNVNNWVGGSPPPLGGF